MKIIVKAGGVGPFRRRGSGQAPPPPPMPDLDASGNKLVARLEDDAFISEQDLVSSIIYLSMEYCLSHWLDCNFHSALTISNEFILYMLQSKKIIFLYKLDN